MPIMKDGDHVVMGGMDPLTGLAVATVHPESGAEPYEVLGSPEPMPGAEPFHLDRCNGLPAGMPVFHARSTSGPPMVNSKEYCTGWERIFRSIG